MSEKFMKPFGFRLQMEPVKDLPGFYKVDAHTNSDYHTFYHVETSDLKKALENFIPVALELEKEWEFRRGVLRAEQRERERGATPIDDKTELGEHTDTNEVRL